VWGAACADNHVASSSSDLRFEAGQLAGLAFVGRLGYKCTHRGHELGCCDRLVDRVSPEPPPHAAVRLERVVARFVFRLAKVESAAGVEIGTSSRGLVLAWAPTSSTVEDVNAVLTDEGLSASRPVYHGYPSGFRDLVQFFEEMERDWRGWDGDRTWKSLEGDLRIAARHEYGHVQFSITLRHVVAGWDRSGWSATVDVSVDPGEQLSASVRDVQTLEPS
jgi:hypothetical protein